MAAAQLNHGIDLNGNSQHSVKAMLIQKHLNELEKYNQNRNQDENASVEEIDVDSPSDSGCEDKATHWHSANKRSHSPTHDSENDSEPYCKLPRMIDVETVDPNEKPVIAPVEQTQNRNVFSIRNLIYTKDTSDSESAESEDSGNVNSSTGGNSPNSSNNEAAWRPDPDMLHRLKAELVQTLHTFVDTVVSDVVAKVASTNQYQGQSQKKKKKKFNRKTSNDSSSNDSSNSSSTGHVTTSEKSFSNSEPKQFTTYEPAKIVTKFEPGANHQPVAPMTQSTQPSVNQLAASQRGMSPMPNSIHTFNPLNRPQVNPIRPSPHHTVALQQQAALNAVRQNPLFLQR